MKSIRILFYRAKLGDGHIVDNLIDWHTTLWNWPPKQLRCSHTEIWTQAPVVNDGKLYHIWDNGQCWTSTMRFDSTEDNKGGVCVRPASEVLKYPERWFFCEITMSELAYDLLLNELYRAVNNNQGYDQFMIASFFLPWRIGDPAKFICSEFVAYFIKLIASTEYLHSPQLRQYYNDYKAAPSPVRLALRLAECGFRFYDLETGKEIIFEKGK